MQRGAGRKHFFSAWHLFLLVFLVPQIIWARPVPALSGPVVDEAGIFSPEGKNQLAAALEKYFQESKNQFQVLTVKSLDGDVLEEFSIRVADAWKIGGRESDRGLILLLAQAERKVRIEVGQGLEGDIPDAFAGRVIDQVMVPQFRAGNLEQGVIVGLQALAEKLGGQLDLSGMPVHPRHQQGLPGWAVLLIILIIFIFQIFGVRHGRRGGVGYWGGGGFSGGGGFGSSGGGGSSWGGGGGGFSGGGSSGGW